MNIYSILSPARTRCHCEGGSKKRVLEDIANLIAEDYPAVNGDELFRRLIGRERLGSTGVGNGVAIPHCRIENCSSTLGSLVSLQQPIDFEAPDGQPVDLLFTLLVPEEAHDEHLQTLATLAQAFSNAEILAKLRSAASDEQLYAYAQTVFQDL